MTFQRKRESSRSSFIYTRSKKIKEIKGDRGAVEKVYKNVVNFNGNPPLHVEFIIRGKISFGGG
jgi:hypothetical protein